jgi:uncharacterized protein YbjT (DUF2867 family)
MIFYIRYMHALIVGASGEVGSALMSLLSSHHKIDKITSLVRRPSNLNVSKIMEQIIDFNDLSSLDNSEVDVAFCCLGTTMKKAGSKAAFEQVDLDYVIAFAKLAQRAGAKQFHVISASGADKTSMFFYNRVKGHMEEYVRQIGFDNTIIYRPSLLVSDRKEKRAGERFAIQLFKILNLFLLGPLKKFASISTKKVAAGMIRKMENPVPGVEIVLSDEI